MVRTTNFIFVSEGLKLTVFRAQPESGGPFPVVLVNHGGGGMEGAYEEMCLELAGQGYLALAMTFRGFPGSEGHQEYGKGEIQDLLNLVQWLRSDERQVDANRMGMFGYSRGALKALLACERSPEFKAVVVWSAPTDMELHHMINPFIGDLIGGSPEELPEEYRLRSPLPRVSNINCPLLIIHGEMDEVVPIEHAHLLMAELKKHKKLFEVKTYPGEGHTFSWGAFQDAWRETITFFNKYLFPGT